jgi:hypothetical protein
MRTRRSRVCEEEGNVHRFCLEPWRSGRAKLSEAVEQPTLSAGLAAAPRAVADSGPEGVRDMDDLLRQNIDGTNISIQSSDQLLSMSELIVYVERRARSTQTIKYSMVNDFAGENKK